MEQKNIKRDVIFTIVTIVFMIAMGGVVILLEHFLTSPDEVRMTGGNMTPSCVEKDVMNIWYYDDSMTEYLQDCAAEYEAENGVKIECTLMSREKFLENVNDANMSGENVPDLYVMDSTRLEKACMAGLITENNNDELYNDKTFSKTAVRAVTYKDKMYAYPMNFDTAVLAYNADVVSEVPTTFDDIIDYSNNMSDSINGKLDNVLMWDVKELMFSYGFVGEYMKYGGENGDDATVKEFVNEGVNKAMAYYKNLNQIFYIDLNNTDYETVLQKFAEGKIAFTILDTEGVRRLRDMGDKVNFLTMKYPDMNDNLKTKAMAVTNVMAVNAFSGNRKEAGKIAEYFTYTKADEMYEKTGYLSGRKDIKYDDVMMDVFLAQYEESDNLPKLMEAGDFGAKLENVLNIIWQGGDVENNMKSLE